MPPWCSRQVRLSPHHLPLFCRSVPEPPRSRWSPFRRTRSATSRRLHPDRRQTALSPHLPGYQYQPVLRSPSWSTETGSFPLFHVFLRSGWNVQTHACSPRQIFLPEWIWDESCNRCPFHTAESAEENSTENHCLCLPVSKSCPFFILLYVFVTIPALL